MSEKSFVINQLSKKYGKKNVLIDFSYEFGNGCYALLGPNGAGKTTLIKCMAGLISPGNGNMLLDKKEVTAFDKIGYLPQKSGVFPSLTVCEQLEYFANIKGIPKREWKSVIDEILVDFNLEKIRNKKGKKLSGGMIRRIGIAQAFMGKPQIIILDEPAEGLDPEERLRLRNVIKKWKKECIIIISTHVVEDILDIADDILIMNEGCLVASGTSKEICEEAQGKIYQIPLDKVTAQDIVINSFENECRVFSMRDIDKTYEVSPTLEDGYLVTIKVNNNENNSML